MRRSRTAIVTLLAAALTGLLMLGTGPAQASTQAAQRIADLAGHTFATASDATQNVTMQPPVPSGGYQHWTFTSVGANYVVTNAATQGCLAHPTAWPGPNPPVVQRPCFSGAAGTWALIRSPHFTDAYMFRNVGLGGCMGMDHRDPALLYLYACDELAGNQQFRLM